LVDRRTLVRNDANRCTKAPLGERCIGERYRGFDAGGDALGTTSQAEPDRTTVCSRSSPHTGRDPHTRLKRLTIGTLQPRDRSHDLERRADGAFCRLFLRVPQEICNAWPHVRVVSQVRRPS